MLRKLLVVSGLALLAVGCSAAPDKCPYCGADLTKPYPHGAPAAAVVSSATTTAAQPTAQATGAMAPAAATVVATNVYHIPPATLFEQAQTALKADGFTIDSAKDGIIQTSWRSYEGELHVFRRWEEQSRFRVTVVPDINNPTGAARLDIVEETQRRSNPKATWEAAGPRPDRDAQVLASIQNRISGK